MRPGGAILQAFGSFRLEAVDPFADSLGADPEGCRDGGPGLFLFEYPAHQLGSTERRQACILVDVHSAPLGIRCVSTISFLGQSRMDNLLRDHI